MARTPRPDTPARRKLEALSFITTRLDGLSTDSVLRVLAWMRSTSSMAEVVANLELEAMSAVTKRLRQLRDADERRSVLRWLDDHYLADDADPQTLDIDDLRAAEYADDDLPPIPL